MQERAAILTERLISDGFKVDEMLDSQVVAIAGTQRGGKGTLAGILVLLSQALDSELQVKYFSAGVDIYPVKCSLCSALQYPELDIEKANQKVSDALLKYLRSLANDPPTRIKMKCLWLMKL